MVGLSGLRAIGGDISEPIDHLGVAAAVFDAAKALRPNTSLL
jgi:hypothetical protein